MNIQDIISRLKAESQQLEIQLFSGATDNQIKYFEEQSGVKMPEDFKEFYRFSNGFYSAEDMFYIIPLQDIDIERSPDHGIVFAEYMIYSNGWIANISPDAGEYLIYDLSCETILGKSLAEFISRFMSGGVFEEKGLYDWPAERESSANNKYILPELRYSRDVESTNGTPVRGKIARMEYHSKDQEYKYYLQDESGKMLKRRYNPGDLQLAAGW